LRTVAYQYREVHGRLFKKTTNGNSDAVFLNTGSRDRSRYLRIMVYLLSCNVDGFVKSHFFHFSVIPAEAGIQ